MKILDIGCGKSKYKSKNKKDNVIGLDMVKMPAQEINITFKPIKK